MNDSPQLDAEERYQRLHESMTDGFGGVTMDGRIIQANRALRDMLGYTMEELSELTFLDVTPAEWHHFDTRIIEDQVIPHGHSEIFEKEFRHKDGTRIPAEMHIFLVRDDDGHAAEMWATVRDITERKRLEAELREANELLERRVEERTSELLQSESRYRHLAEAAWEGIAISENGMMVDSNPRFTEMFGWPHKDLVGTPALQLVAPSSRALVKRNMRAGYERAYQFDGLKRDGTVFPVEVRARMMSVEGRLLRVSVFQDLTETRRIKAKLTGQRQALELAGRRARLGEVGASIAHQIAQPLCAVRNNVAVARIEAAECPFEKCNNVATLLDIDTDLRKIAGISDSLRQLANPERQQRKSMVLNQVVTEILQLFESSIVPRRIQLTTKLQKDLPPLSMDQLLISQVILNLLQNAVDSCSGKEATVTVTTHSPDPDTVELSISDTGPGIDPEILPQIFDFLFTNKPDGTGVGLALCKRIASAHGGTIEAANNGKRPGATFRLRLPVNPPPS